MPLVGILEFQIPPSLVHVPSLSKPPAFTYLVVTTVQRTARSTWCFERSPRLSPGSPIRVGVRRSMAGNQPKEQAETFRTVVAWRRPSPSLSHSNIVNVLVQTPPKTLYREVQGRYRNWEKQLRYLWRLAPQQPKHIVIECE